MSLMIDNQEKNRLGSPIKIPDGARILIVCDDSYDMEWLKAILQEEGFVSERAKSIAAGCEAAKSGEFQVIVSAPLLKDGSWMRLSDVANHFDLRFEIVLWVRDFDLREWAVALEQGAFDVLDARCEQPKTVEATKCALWAAYLKGAGPNPRAASPRKAA